MIPPLDTPQARAKRRDAESAEAAVNWAMGKGMADRVRREVAVEVKRVRRRRVQATAGALGLLLVAGLIWQSAVWRTPPAVPAVAATGAHATVLRPERQVLSDGSIVDLKPGAVIAVDFSAAIRHVTLWQGEAFFQVAKNPRRPFIVSAAGVEARAVGTAFIVQLGASAVEVLVSEGRVAVDRSREQLSAELSSHPLAMVGAGNRVVVELASPATSVSVQPVSAPEMTDRESWRVPRLEFASMPLAEVIPLFNQHSGARLVLGDPALGDLRLSGVLRADNTSSLLRILEVEFQVQAEPQDGVIVLRRK